MKKIKKLKTEDMEKTKIRTNITLSPIIFQKVKDYDLNLSTFVQMRLIEYFTYLEGNTLFTQNVQSYTLNTQKETPKKHM